MNEMRYTENSKGLMSVFILSLVVIPVTMYYDQLTFLYFFIIIQNLVFVFHKHPVIISSHNYVENFSQNNKENDEKKVEYRKKEVPNNRWLCKCGESNFSDVLRCKACNTKRYK